MSPSPSFRHVLLLLLLLLLTCVLYVIADSSTASKPALPRSVTFRTYSDGDSPLWNPSDEIDAEGFLSKNYIRIPSELEVGKDAIGGKHRKSKLTGVPVRIRQVPGDGNCLFHSLTVCLAKTENGTHFCYSNIAALKEYSRMLREHAVDFLSHHPHRLLYLQGREYMRARDLIETAASPYGCTADEYCETMRQESFWGGGPEVVALCNLLKRPIHIYELYPYKKREFRLRRMACFGSPKFDRKEALHILSADSRFPDVVPGKQLAAGNHFLALFPEESKVEQKRKRVRGGGSSSSSSGGSFLFHEEDYHDDDEHRGGLGSLVISWWQFIISGIVGQD